MLIFVLDDEKLLLDALEDAVREACPDAAVRAYGLACDAVNAMREGIYPDAVFSDIEMPGMTGMELARAIYDIKPKTNIIFVTGYKQHMQEAYSLWVSGYVLKPVSADKIREQLAHLRYPILEKPIRIQCFGNFEVFANNKPVKFRYAKSKEMLAYLVDRKGAAFNTSQLCAVLWEDAEDSERRRSLFRNIVADLIGTLSRCGGRNVVNKGYNLFSVNMTAVKCDLYDYLTKNPDAVKSYAGEYMSQYSWAETQMAGFARRKDEESE